MQDINIMSPAVEQLPTKLLTLEEPSLPKMVSRYGWAVNRITMSIILAFHDHKKKIIEIKCRSQGEQA